MTKKAMIDFIEKTGIIVNFNRNYLNKHYLKSDIEKLYNKAVAYAEKKRG